MDQQQYCLKWSNYSSNLAAAFSNLFDSATLTDVTLVCGGTVFNAHKVILAACSKNFADLFERAPVGTGQICVMLEATSADNMHALLEFMYKGEVHVSQKALESFLKAAENLQVKGLTTEHGRFASANATQSQQPAFHESNNLPSPAARRQQRNSLSASLESINRIGGKNESLAGSGGGGGGAGGGSGGTTTPNFSSYLPPTYMPQPYETTNRKRSIRSPFYEETTRGSVLRDGKATGVGNDSPVSGSKNYRPSSSGSSAAPTEADTVHTDRDSPHQSNRYENHSPSTTHHGNGNGPVSSNTLERDDRSDRAPSEDKIKIECKEGNDTGAEDLRMKSNEMRPIQSPLTSSAPPTPTTPVTFLKGGLPGGLDGLTPTVDMISKKLQCPLCDRQYGYETNLRAHIRQRHQGIRVPCPYCSRTFTRNNTVRRHIAREHKTQTTFMPNQLHS
ncbi:zinc finger protein chinmo isoform X4 [Ochlerotatus camptorhynchus]|uniref:zinc finger protein chinmo isoform X4 n=1 Tax=Ochlerotatus camptorhynchus TaxID=644619 RepID=UPI0031E0B159